MARDKRIEHWDDERSLGNSLIVSLKPGYAFNFADTPNAEHVRGFDTVKEAMRDVRKATVCKCYLCEMDS